MNGFFDLQVNGYAGIDFNAENLTGEQLHEACLKLRADGVEGILLTLITDAIPSLRAKIENVVSLCQQEPTIAQMVCGLHIEGPFLSPSSGYIGTHPARYACQANWHDMDSLLEAGQGMIKLVTIAPEMDPGMNVTRRLADTGVLVSGGHSNASIEQLQEAIDAGLSMFTHLGNGCPPLLDRHDNIISRVLSLADQLWISFIADGAHIPFFALKNYLKIVSIERAIVVTDAISAAGNAPGLYQIGEKSVFVGDDGVPRSEDGTHLIGSGATMPEMVNKLRDELLLTESQIDQLTRENPRKVLALHLNPTTI